MVEKDNMDLFKEAAAISIKTKIDSVDKPVIVEEQLNRALAVTEEGDKNWEALTIAMKGRYAKKFMTVLDDMPDREFVRNYLKALEYFQPKITRQEPGIGDVADKIIQIQILKIDSEGNQKVIDITDTEHE